MRSKTVAAITIPCTSINSFFLPELPAVDGASTDRHFNIESLCSPTKISKNQCLAMSRHRILGVLVMVLHELCPHQNQTWTFRVTRRISVINNLNVIKIVVRNIRNSKIITMYNFHVQKTHQEKQQHEQEQEGPQDELLQQMVLWAPSEPRPGGQHLAGSGAERRNKTN
eukprot:6470204-Amphidinium_carterae.1